MLKQLLTHSNVLKEQMGRAFTKAAKAPPKPLKEAKKPKKKVQKMQLPPTTMNECPVPYMDYNRWFAERSSAYNKIFFSGTIAFFGSVAILISSPPFEMNYEIPDIDL